jgi:hypothetical protein
MTWPQLADGRGFAGPIPTAYHITGTPAIFILDRDGKIFAKPNSARQIEEHLQKALDAPR